MELRGGRREPGDGPGGGGLLKRKQGIRRCWGVLSAGPESGLESFQGGGVTAEGAKGGSDATCPLCPGPPATSVSCISVLPLIWEHSFCCWPDHGTWAVCPPRPG